MNYEHHFEKRLSFVSMYKDVKWSCMYLHTIFNLVLTKVSSTVEIKWNYLPRPPKTALWRLSFILHDISILFIITKETTPYPSSPEYCNISWIYKNYTCITTTCNVNIMLLLSFYISFVVSKFQLNTLYKIFRASSCVLYKVLILFFYKNNRKIREKTTVC